MKKMYIGLSIALLMSGAVCANTVTITNNSDTNVVVGLGFQSVQKGKNLTTGQATDVCYQGGSADGFVEKGKSGSIDYSPCQPGVSVTVTATPGKNKAAAIRMGMVGSHSKNVTIGTKYKESITVSGKDGKYTLE